MILKKILKYFNKNYPYYSNKLYKNFEELIDQLSNIKKQKAELLKLLPSNIVTLNKSLEYFLGHDNTVITRLAIGCQGNITLNNLTKINNLAQQNKLCLILESQSKLLDSNNLFYKKIKIVRVDSEKWYNEKAVTSDLIIIKLREVINKLYNCSYMHLTS